MKTPKSLNDNMIKTLNTQTGATKEIKSTSTGTKATKMDGVHQVGSNVIFSTLCPDASTVQIGGEFNDWQPERNSMKRVGNEGVWQLTLRLSPGTYRYRLFINGQWQQDPCNKLTELNPYGGLNSVVTVR
jgi:1,4-alpha-glucan branching enzyme